MSEPLIKPAHDTFPEAAQRASLLLAALLPGALVLSLWRQDLSALAGAGALGLALLVVRLRAFAVPRSLLPNLVTALRVALTCFIALAGMKLAPTLTALLVAAIFTLDGVDGTLARRLGASSRLGAHFDMESDGFLVLTLCALLSLRGVGAWVLTGGLLRYAYVGVTRLVPSRGEAPPSRAGRYAFSVSLMALSLALVSERALATASAALGTLVLVWSFGRSFYWALRRPSAVL
jgi:phosphatidylglycerophosphate synthase